jgi:tRNA A37 methylthiotransferase MiaB
MRRFGGRDRFVELLDSIRARVPTAGARSNVIVGFPGETEADVAELEAFLIDARLDAVGVFGYSDEDGTEAEGMAGKIDSAEVARRVERVSALADELVGQRADDRIGEVVDVLIESIDGDVAEGRGEHQAPEVDGSVTLAAAGLTSGDLVPATVTGAVGADLTAKR